MLSGPLTRPRLLTPCGLRTQRQLLMHGLSWQDLQGRRFTFAPVADEPQLEAFAGGVGWLDLTQVRAIYAQAGHLAAFHTLLSGVADAAFPTHHLLTPSEAEPLIRRLEYDALEPDDEEDEPETWRSPPLDGSDIQERGAARTLPAHLQTHQDAVRAAAVTARRHSLVFGDVTARHHTLVLTRAEDREPLTWLKDWLEFEADDATFTVDARDLPDLWRVMRAGRALWGALLHVEPPAC